MAESESASAGRIIRSLAVANNHLAVKLHRLLAEEKGNVFFSPFSISTAMAMLLCAAEGETECEIKAALGHNEARIERDEIASAVEQQMLLLLKNPGSYTLSCANSMLSQKGFEMKESYKQILTESFKALMLEVDFKNESVKAVKQINEWVKKKTNNMIPEIIKSVHPSTLIVLLNAVYFKGTWLRQFKKKATVPKNFYNKGLKKSVKKVAMMHVSEYFPFYEDESFQALQLPYVGEEVATLILLPREINGLETVESDLTPSFLQHLKKKLWTPKVEVSLPKFRLEYSKSLIECFQQLGVTRVFSPGAELGRASDSTDLAVSEILHKAVLEVNEEGSEAAAATMVAVAKCARARISKPITRKFVADHPFAFVIYDTRSDLILFMGRVEEL